MMGRHLYKVPQERKGRWAWRIRQAVAIVQILEGSGSYPKRKECNRARVESHCGERKTGAGMKVLNAVRIAPEYIRTCSSLRTSYHRDPEANPHLMTLFLLSTIRGQSEAFRVTRQPWGNLSPHMKIFDGLTARGYWGMGGSPDRSPRYLCQKPSRPQPQNTSGSDASIQKPGNYGTRDTTLLNGKCQRTVSPRSLYQRESTCRTRHSTVNLW
jgi:hypothetical protein